VCRKVVSGKLLRREVLMNLKMGNKLRSGFAVDSFTAPKDLIAFKVFRNSEEESKCFLGWRATLRIAAPVTLTKKTPPGKFRLSEF